MTKSFLIVYRSEKKMLHLENSSPINDGCSQEVLINSRGYFSRENTATHLCNRAILSKANNSNTMQQVIHDNGNCLLPAKFEFNLKVCFSNGLEITT
jgi:hypothetical protein